MKGGIPRVQDVGRKGFMQRRTKYKNGKWYTTGWQFNLKDYKTFDDFVEDLMGLYKDLTNSEMGKAEILAARWWRKNKV